MSSAHSQSATEEVFHAPRIDDVQPAAALPLGEVVIDGARLGPHGTVAPAVLVGTHAAQVVMSRPGRIAFRVPEDATTGLIEVRSPAGVSNGVPLRVARELTSGLHPVTNPAVSRSGMIYATVSGARGKQTPVSVVRVSPDGRATPFVTGILNATGLAFSPDGDLFVTSRALGAVYRVDGTGESTQYVEGMGVATGAVFDAAGNLFVGDRSGTIFKIDPERRIFVHATLEPSIAAYHLAVDAEGTLFVTSPSLSSNDAIWAIDTHGQARVWFRGLGRPQGLALAENGDVYLAACLRGRHGLVRVTPQGEATLVVAGDNLVGVAFSPQGTTVLATNEAVYDVDLGVEGMHLS
ncbi:MAG: SMP-30/gluconolactonase/LRE family protein [Rhodoferax sp.]|nr:SMP-30/gluconolactonase/LRE family protein [Rhodoferax sp.]